MKILIYIIFRILYNSFALQLIVNSGGRTWIDEKAYGYKPPSEILWFIPVLWGNAYLNYLYFMTIWQIHKYLPQKETLSILLCWLILNVWQIV